MPLSNKKIPEELHAQAAENRLLYEAGRLLGSTLDIDRVYAVLRDLIAQEMDCDGLLVSSFDPVKSLIRCAYAWIEGQPVDAAGFPAIPLAPEGRGMQSVVIRSGKPLRVDDVEAWQQKMNTVYHVDADGTVRNRPAESKPRAQSALMVPITLEGRVLGIVQVMSHRKATYTKKHLRLLEALVLQMAAASRNAHLYQQAQDELRERMRAEEELRRNEEAQRHFQAQLTALHEIGNVLSKAATFDDLCRQAVELGRSRLGFDRLGIWFLADTPGFVQGAFGTDEHGAIRDERKSRIPYRETSAMGQVLSRKMSTLSLTEAALLNNRNEVVGQGWHALAALWNGEEVIGCISADNLLEGRPITEAQGEILTLYASTLGHLCSRKRAEEALAQKQAQIEALNRRLQQAMAETHHRVKNNLQIIASMVDMRLMDSIDQVSVEELRRLGACIGALATVHDVLTQEAKEDGEAVSVSARAVLQRLMPLLQQTALGRRLRCEIRDVRLSTKQGTSLALIANELIGNAIKHGKGEIRIHFESQDNLAALEVSDEGPGFPEGFDPRTVASTGLELVQSLSQLDLRGQTRYENRSEGGACVRLTFPVCMDE